MATDTLVLSGFRVTDPSSNIYDFQLLKTGNGGVGWTLETRPWEPGDPAQRWRVSVHPFIGGLHEDRLYPNPRTYAKANADATYPNILLFPPLINNTTGANLSAPVKLVVFDSKIFAIGGRYVYMLDPSTNTLSEDEDLGSGVSAVDATPFNNELVVACGESTKIFTRATNGTYTQASDNTFAIALGVVGSQLWRAEETNEISFCFPKETRVRLNGTRLRSATRRKFTGNVVEITTSLGHQLTGTPNHPVLTDRGWVALGSLVEGDNVFTDRFEVDGLTPAEPDVNDVDATIGEVFDTLALVGRNRKRKVGLAPDFHGDGQDGDVDVVTVDSKLWNWFQSINSESGSEQFFTDSDPDEVPLFASSSGDSVSGTFGKAASMASLRHRTLGSLFGGVQPRVAGKSPLASIPHVDTTGLKEFADGQLTATEFNPDPSGGVSTVVKRDRVSSVVFRGFDDYVYNLETETHWFLANAIVAHNCNSSPRTLANWSPADGSEYTAGDETFAVHTIVDYGGIPWPLKGDGAYAPDPQSRFKNQTPQIKRTPFADNCKGAFVAQGALWLPCIDGLYRVKPGKSHKRGPEVTFRPSYRFRVRGGVEYGEFIYLLVTDSAGVGQTFICKMSAEAFNEDLGHEYIYQEWARLGSTDLGYAIGVTTAGTSPKLCFTTGTDDFNWIDLGRGGGRDADDGLYRFGTAMELESGFIQVGPDPTVHSSLAGVDVLLDFARTNESLTVSYKWDGATSYTNLLDEAESGGGSAPITSTTLFDRVSRFASSGNDGHLLEVKLAGTAAFGGTANAAVSTTDTTLTDTRMSIDTNAAVGLVVTCDGKTMTVTSNTSDTLTGSSWSGGGNPGNGDAWSLNAGGLGTQRPTIREVWAYGYSHPQETDIISLGVVGDETIAPGRSETLRLFRQWKNDGSELLVELEGYERSRNTRFRVIAVEEENTSASPGNHRGQSDYDSLIRVALCRVDRAGAYADA